MPEEILKVGITGDASGLEQASKKAAEAIDKIGYSAKNSGVVLTKTLGDLQSQLKRFELGLKTAGNTESFARLQRAIEATKERINVLNNINSFQKFGKGANEATQSLINLSRVAQDAPFGFIGIANNINPLLESFQRLQKETGGTKSALAALGSSLMGAGGLGLAVGVVSSLLVVFGDKLFSSKSSANELAESLKKVGEAAEVAGKQVQDLGSDLSFLNQAAKIKIEIAGGKDQQALREQIQNTQEAIDKILLIRKQLQEKQDAINVFDFKVGSEEREAAEKSVQQLSDAIQQTIKDEAEESRKVFFLQQQIRVADIKDQKEAAEKAEEVRKKALRDAEKNAREALENLKKYQDERSRIIAEASRDFGELKIFTLPDVGDPKDNKELSNRLREKLQEVLRVSIESLRGLPPIQMPIPPIVLSTDKTSQFSVAKQFEKIMETFVPVIQAIDPKNVPIPLKPTITWQPTDFQKQYESFIKDVQGIIANAEIGVAFNLGQGIADALSGQGLENAFKNIAGIMGDFLQELGKLLIKSAVVVEAFKKAFAALLKNPVAALAVGIGLVALGGIIKNTILPKPKGFAKGGTVPGHGSGDTVPAMLTPGEFVVPKKFAKIAAMLFDGGFKMPKISNNVFHFAEGGFVPSVERSSPIQQIKNIITPAKTEFPDYMPVIQWSYDSLRVGYQRANKAKTIFGG